MAQNKIPHQTISNISATSGLILKILEVAQSWHFSESNGASQCIHCTLIIQPHYRVKQLLWKLQFFTGEFFGNTRFDEWPPNSPDLNPLHYPCMSGELCLNATRHFNPSQNTSDELKKVLQTIWDDLQQNSVNKAILSFVKRLKSLCESWGRTLLARLQINFFVGFWTVSKLWQSEMSNFHVFVWFQYKHYDENCNFHCNCFTECGCIIKVQWIHCITLDSEKRHY